MMESQMPEMHMFEMDAMDAMPPVLPVQGQMMPAMPYMQQMPDICQAPVMQQMPVAYQMPQMLQMPAYPCIPQETVLYNVRLARAYVPFQQLCTLYPPVEGLDKGTAFPELYSPYVPENKWVKPPKHE